MCVIASEGLSSLIALFTGSLVSFSICYVEHALPYFSVHSSFGSLPYVYSESLAWGP